MPGNQLSFRPNTGEWISSGQSPRGRSAAGRLCRPGPAGLGGALLSGAASSAAAPRPPPPSPGPRRSGAPQCQPSRRARAPPGVGVPAPRAPPGVGGSRTQGPGEGPQREGREPGRSGGGLWLFLAELGRPPEAFPTFQKFLGTGGRRGPPYIEPGRRERRRGDRSAVREGLSSGPGEGGAGRGRRAEGARGARERSGVGDARGAGRGGRPGSGPGGPAAAGAGR